MSNVFVLRNIVDCMFRCGRGNDDQDQGFQRLPRWQGIERERVSREREGVIIIVTIIIIIVI